MNSPLFVFVNIISFYMKEELNSPRQKNWKLNCWKIFPLPSPDDSAHLCRYLSTFTPKI